MSSRIALFLILPMLSICDCSTKSLALHCEKMEKLNPDLTVRDTKENLISTYDAINFFVWNFQNFMERAL